MVTWTFLDVLSSLGVVLACALKKLRLCFHLDIWYVYRSSSGTYLDFSKGFGHQPGSLNFPGQTYDPSTSYILGECERLRRENASLQLFRCVFFFSAHICYYKYSPHILHVTGDAYRDSHGKRLDELSDQVRSLATGFKDLFTGVKNLSTGFKEFSTGFKELSKTVASALEDGKFSNSDGAQSVSGHTKHLERLDREDFMGVRYWDRAAWFEVRNGKADVKPDDPVLTLFFEDAAGNPVTKSEIQAVRNHAHAYFALLWNSGRAPTTWSNASLNIRIEFIRGLEEEFEFLRYCDRHWKSEQIFMNYYPQFYRAKMKKGSGKRKQCADGEGNNNSEEDPNRSKCPRVEEPAPPPAQPAPRPVRVCSLSYFSLIHTYNLQNNPL